MSLTLARRALWDAIDHWPALADATTGTGRVFRLTFRFEEDEPLLSEISPAMSDLPAIAIEPLRVSPEWLTHEMQQWPVVYSVRIWTPDWRLPESEALVEHVVAAFYQAGETPGLSYVKAATGFHPRLLGPFAFEFVKLGERGAIKATLATLNVALRLAFDPHG